MTESSGDVVKNALIKGWKRINDDHLPSELMGYNHHLRDIYSDANIERRVVCFKCEKITFYDTHGGEIWFTEGSGEGILPPSTQVVVKNGTSRVM
ncbi:hypothetical protein PMG11_10419 [Penicillium brasilianum]|uniref:Uncharacterized protein n=1 Tax=Penicillium brasilianum TaxID=104259 RepID=A0A0F7U3G2_PENBI|nr:hypothetical protein PMG11_10419 [Penicillium brasilianum]